MPDKVTIKIPRYLYRRLSQVIESTGFSSVTEFIVFVLRTVVSGKDTSGEDKLTVEEIKTIRSIMTTKGRKY